MKSGRCIIEDCDGIGNRRGLCNKHRKRLRRYGDPRKTVYRPCGEGSLRVDGYWTHRIDGRPVLRHVLVAEKALGKRLPKGAQIHHVDGDRSNDANTNLVICDSVAYHRLLHIRQRALDACGHVRWRKCHICQKYDAPENLRFYEPSGLVRHIECWRRQYQERKGATNVVHV